ncbi:hypothetical protein [Psychrobacter sp. I-STPA6b]|uniref:hypothetical protein n=1 Tax=Psychrobacter sp. I-STPA6b TaxID=2585718 RepID=UPI001D0C6D73|nr:hypothetical protein [Psychrobacter sp. I-STPA6b]
MIKKSHIANQCLSWFHTSSQKSASLYKGISASLLVGVMSFALVACNKQADSVTPEADTEKEASVEVNGSSSAEQETNTTGQATNADEQGTPVVYDTKSWSSGSGDTYAINEIDKMKKVFGSVTSSDENSLDYASNSATKYRFVKDNDPYLDIIDSNDYLEIGWYYANPKDSDAEKKTSIEHAKKAYQLAHNLMGESGGALVENILMGQIVKNKEVGGQQVELAKCEFYSCMLILKK